MIFSKQGIIAASAIMLVTACGGGDTPQTADSEIIVENPSLTPTPSNDDATETAAPVETVEASEAFAALPEPYQTADYNRGRRTFKLCQSCHTLNDGGQNLVGPNLYGIFGREIGAVEGFTYSKAVQDADITWTPDILAEWLESPRNFLPGNKMSFAGVRRPDDRTAVIAYIMAETGYTGE